MIGFELVASLHYTATEETCQLQHVTSRSHPKPSHISWSAGRKGIEGQVAEASMGHAWEWHGSLQSYLIEGNFVMSLLGVLRREVQLCAQTEGQKGFW